MQTALIEGVQCRRATWDTKTDCFLVVLEVTSLGLALLSFHAQVIEEIVNIEARRTVPRNKRARKRIFEVPLLTSALQVQTDSKLGREDLLSRWSPLCPSRGWQCKVSASDMSKTRAQLTAAAEADAVAGSGAFARQQ